MTPQLGSRMRGPPDGAGDWMRTREVMGAFHFREALLDAADERLVAGNKRADTGVSAPVDELNRRWNDRTIAAADLSDPPITPRRSFAGFDDALGAEIVVGSLAGCIAAIAVAAMLAWQHAPGESCAAFRLSAG